MIIVCRVYFLIAPIILANKYYKIYSHLAGLWWLTAINLATQEAGISV
jgi:hypothetical protein